METGIQSSFIPKDAAVPQTAHRVSVATGSAISSLFGLIATVLLVASVALAVAVFLYGRFLESQSASKLEQLHVAERSFDPVLIQQLSRFDDRMHVAQQLLDMHLAPTTFFQALNQSTLATVSFKNLTFTGDPSGKQLLIKMSGIAQSINSIALQADVLNKSGIITNPIFSKINRQPGGVQFDLNAIVNPSQITYQALVGGVQPQAVPVIPSQGTSPPVSTSTPTNIFNNGSGGTQQ